MSHVEVADLRLSFGRVLVLSGVSLAAEAGRLLAVVGPSGCGKTTLLRAIAGFERPSAGVIRIGGQVVSGPAVHVPPHRRRVAVVPQEGALFPHLTVAQNVGFGLGRGGARSPRVTELLDLAGLAELAGRMPHELSGGQRQRVAVVRAIAAEPAVVLLDEPFSALDAGLRVELRTEVRELLARAGTTAILVTHDQEEALSLAGSVAVMRGGTIAQQGSPDEVYRHPVDLGVAEFLGDANVIPGVAAGSLVSSALGSLPLSAAASGPVRVLVRPEQLRLGTGVSGVVVGRSYFGHDALLDVRLDDGTVVRARTPAHEVRAVGAAVSLVCEGDVTAYAG